MSLEVDPDRLRRAAGSVFELHDSVRGILDTLQRKLDSRGPFWKHGQFGAAFGDGPHGYVAASDELLQSGRNLATTLDDFGNAMTNAADSLAGSDIDGSNRLGR